MLAKAFQIHLPFLTPPFITLEGVSQSPERIYKARLINVDGTIEKEGRF